MTAQEGESKGRGRAWGLGFRGRTGGENGRHGGGGGGPLQEHEAGRRAEERHHLEALAHFDGRHAPRDEPICGHPCEG